MELKSDSPVVVIGGGIAGVSSIEILAQELTDKHLILISASSLIKVVSNLRTIGQTINEFDVSEESNNYLENKYKNIRVINNKVIEINASKHELILENGDHIQYNKLCVCCGGKPKLIEEQNNDLKPYILGIRDTETVHSFQSKLKSSKRIVIVGNGGIATELVYEIQNCHIIWSIKDDSFGATFFDPIAAKFFSDFLNNDKNESDLNETNISKRLKYTVSNDCNQYIDHNEYGTALGPDWALGLQIKGNSNKSVRIEYNCEVKAIYKSIDTIPESKKCFIDNSFEGIY
jgi:pyruvate/2-oxoglutarate dehydrogenase complex dihydrolipoamide dehydrogenase (E3) component